MNKNRIPTYHIKTIFDIKPETLLKKGIKCVLTDLDNTLDCYKDKNPSQRVIEKVKDFHDAGLEVIIISNNHKKRVGTYAEQAGLEMRYHMLKPFAFKINKLLKEKGYNKNDVIMVGDQLFTDIEAGNRAKIITVFVDPLTPIDQPFTRIKRKLEKLLIKKMIKRNLFKEWEE